jgi:cytochrome c553
MVSKTMKKTVKANILQLSMLSLILTGFSGCALFTNKPAADTAEATARTAYLTCGGCHGPSHVRVNFMPPIILGQKQGYLAAKLRDFRDMKRIHPAMNGVVEKLTDQDINNLAAYYANYGKNSQ